VRWLEQDDNPNSYELTMIRIAVEVIEENGRANFGRSRPMPSHRPFRPEQVWDLDECGSSKKRAGQRRASA
jgi:hypothetical protein